MHTLRKDTFQHDISRQLIALSVPLIIGNILQQLYNTFDAYVLGHYAGELEFATIGVAGSIMNLFLFAIAGMCNGMLVLFSQYYGARDMEAYRREHAAALFVGMTVTVLLSVSGIFLLPRFLLILQTPEELIPYASRYLTIIFAAFPVSLLYHLYASILRSLGKTFLATMALFSAVIMNLALDLLFIKYLNWGITGAGAATAISQLSAAAVCILFLRKNNDEIWFRRKHISLERIDVVKTIRYSSVTALSQCSIYLGRLLVQGTVNSQGIDMIAAYTATSRIEAFANSFGDSGATATAIVTAHHFGANRKKQISKTFFCSLWLLLSFGLLISAVMYLSAPVTVNLLLTGSSRFAGQNATEYLKLISIFYPLCFTGNTFAGFYEGIGKIHLPFIGAATHLAMRVVLSMLLISDYRLAAVAAATGIGWVYVNIFWSILLKTCKRDGVFTASDPDDFKNLK